MDEVLKLLSVLTGDSRFEETQKSVNKEGGAVTMCEVPDRVEARGVIKGRTEGRKETACGSSEGIGSKKYKCAND